MDLEEKKFRIDFLEMKYFLLKDVEMEKTYFVFSLYFQLNLFYHWNGYINRKRELIINSPSNHCRRDSHWRWATIDWWYSKEYSLLIWYYQISNHHYLVNLIDAVQLFPEYKDILSLSLYQSPTLIISGFDSFAYMCSTRANTSKFRNIWDDEEREIIPPSGCQHRSY